MMPKLFFDYVGHGRQRQARDCPYSTTGRTDLIEAL